MAVQKDRLGGGRWVGGGSVVSGVAGSGSGRMGLDPAQVQIRVEQILVAQGWIGQHVARL